MSVGGFDRTRGVGTQFDPNNCAMLFVDDEEDEHEHFDPEKELKRQEELLE